MIQYKNVFFELNFMLHKKLNWLMIMKEMMASSFLFISQQNIKKNLISWKIKFLFVFILTKKQEIRYILKK